MTERGFGFIRKRLIANARAHVTETIQCGGDRELFRLFRESGYDCVTLCEVGRGMPTPDAGAELLRYYKALWRELVG